MKKFFCVFVKIIALFFLFFLKSCQTLKQEEGIEDFYFDKVNFTELTSAYDENSKEIKELQDRLEKMWISLEKGFSIIEIKDKKERKTEFLCAKIDLSNPEIELVYYPHEKDFYFLNSQNDKTSKDSKKSLLEPVFKGKTTKVFAEENDALIAINASPFTGEEGKSGIKNRLSKKRMIKGIHRAEGKNLSREEKRYGALIFYCNEENIYSTKKTLRAKIIENQNDEEIEKAYYAFGGFFCILKDGKPYGNWKENYDWRSTVFTKDDGKTLYLAVFKNASFFQCALAAKNMGCSQALEFDGGSSSYLKAGNKKLGSVISEKIVQANQLGFKTEDSSSPSN